MKCIGQTLFVFTIMLMCQLVQAESRSIVSDIQLGQDGTFHGQIVNRQGHPVANQQVTLKQGEATIAHAKTDGQGNFTIGDLNSGVYILQTANSTSIHRLWAPHVAPPAAHPGVMVVSDSQAVRGQLGALGGLGGLGAAALFATGGYFLIDEITDNGPAS